MNFSVLVNILPKIQSLELPGREAHNKVMQLSVRKNIFKDVKHSGPVKQAAVLALLYPDTQNNTKIVLILRKTYNGHHSGQIAFPGGKQEPTDSSLWHTALRETQEEIGISAEKIQLLKQLSPVFIPVSHFKVQPFFAISDQTLTFKKDPVEVDQILELPISGFLNNPMINISHNYYGKTYPLKAFYNNGLKIWGATAMILSELVWLFEKANTDNYTD